ncbi:hypothetical protein [Halorubellus litoreus]|uniref:HalX domain-containing protein n=1 Tax=Halorubellus litoreus TaxID=755308 RepID=A0ABD5VHZ6_9EURY
MTDTTDEVLLVETVAALATLHEHWLEDAGHAVTRPASTSHIADITDTGAAVAICDRSILEAVTDTATAPTTRHTQSPPRLILCINRLCDPDVVDLPFDDYVEKPVRRPVLLDTVDRVLARDTYADVVHRFASTVNRLALVIDHEHSTPTGSSEPAAALAADLRELAPAVTDGAHALTATDIDRLFAPGTAATIAHNPADAVDP